MSDWVEIKQDVKAMDAKLQVLADQVATVAVSLDRLIQTVERSERVAQQNAATIAEQTRISAEQTRTVSQLVDMVNRLLSERSS
jgi:methyl-accepting chemotaxis protein